MNILYMIDSIAQGGTERQLLELIRNLDKNRFRPHLCTLKTSNNLYDELDIPKISLDFISFSHLSTIKKLFNLSHFIRENRIHVIQTFFQDPFLLAAMMKPFHQLKLIGSFRDLGFWRTPSENLKMRLSYPFFSGFIANSQAVKEHFVKTDGLSPEKIEVIHNGIDIQHLSMQCAENHQANSNQIVGIVANLNRPVKRVDDFIKAAALVREKFPEVRYMIIGDGYLRTKLEELACSLGLKNVVTFTGRIENPIQCICLFSIGVIVSETEGFCNAIMEYMACGVPVVVTDVGGNKEIVVDGQNGFLVPFRDHLELAGKIMRLLKDTREASMMGNAGMETIRTRFSIEKMLNSYYRQYELALLS